MSSAPEAEQLQDLLRGPLGCAFFIAAKQANLDVEQLVKPKVSLDLAAKALAALDPWSGYAEDARNEALERGPDLAALASAALKDQRSKWWRENLLWKPQVHVLEDSDRPRAGNAAPEFEFYAQRPVDAFFTATSFDTTSGLHAALANHVGDWDPQYPLIEEQVELSGDARVYEINNAAAWHRLCVDFPRYSTRAGSLPSGIVCDLSPSWGAVRDAWDGVHLTFAGLLSALFVPVKTHAGTTTLWTWESERTLWLRPVFVSRKRVGSLTEESLRHGGPSLELRLSSAHPADTPDRRWLRHRSTRGGLLGSERGLKGHPPSR